MSGNRLEMVSEGSTFKEMHGPVRGVSRRMTKSEQVCGGVCPEMDDARGCVSQSFFAACDLRAFVAKPQFLH